MIKPDITVVEKHVSEGMLLTMFLLGAAFAALAVGLAWGAFVVGITEGCNPKSASSPAVEGVMANGEPR